MGIAQRVEWSLEQAGVMGSKNVARPADEGRRIEELFDLITSEAFVHRAGLG